MSLTFVAVYDGRRDVSSKSGCHAVGYFAGNDANVENAVCLNFEVRAEPCEAVCFVHNDARTEIEAKLCAFPVRQDDP